MSWRPLLPRTAPVASTTEPGPSSEQLPTSVADQLRVDVAGESSGQCSASFPATPAEADEKERSILDIVEDLRSAENSRQSGFIVNRPPAAKAPVTQG